MTYVLTEKDFPTKHTNLICVETNPMWAVGADYTVGNIYVAERISSHMYKVYSDTSFTIFEPPKFNNWLYVRFIPEVILEEKELFIYRLTGFLPEKYLQKCLIAV